MTSTSTPPPSSSDPSSGALEQALKAELESAQATLETLEQEYASVIADPGVIQEDRDTTRQLLEDAKRARSAAASALERFADGTYGRCVNCGKAIAPERLEAIPDATTCTSCMA